MLCIHIPMNFISFIIFLQILMNVRQESINVIVMLNVITPMEVITATAKQAFLGMALNAKVLGSIKYYVVQFSLFNYAKRMLNLIPYALLTYFYSHVLI